MVLMDSSSLLRLTGVLSERGPVEFWLLLARRLFVDFLGTFSSIVLSST